MRGLLETQRMYNEEMPQTVQQDRPISGLPVNTDLLFADKNGNYKPSIEKKRTKLLRKLGFLDNFLDEDEQIVFVTTGCSPASFFEQYTIGYLWIMLIKRAFFVFTNKRILHIPTTMKFEYRGSIAQILYQDCQQLFVKGSTLHAQYRTGKKESFFGIPRSDGAIIRRMNIAAPEPAVPSARPERSHLCPNCAQVQDAKPSTCPCCGLAFKTSAEALKYSILFPGGGYFYVKRPGLGALDAVGECYLSVITLIALVGTALGNPEAPAIFVAFGVVLALEKLLTIYHAQKFVDEFIPKASAPFATRREAPPGQPSAPAPQPERKQTLEQVLSLR
ncbi:MAG: hypothetical protein JSW27_15560 [Phycisphaerales bacterium]|nr:MAG: hypothetical protein JSW27_15560 [Phycisphaerales bacterium]